MDADRPVDYIEDLKSLGRFRARMAVESIPVNVGRMLYDVAYALERLSLAHSSANPRLRQLAMRLYARYEKPAAARHPV